MLASYVSDRWRVAHGGAFVRAVAPDIVGRATCGGAEGPGCRCQVMGFPTRSRDAAQAETHINEPIKP